MQATNAKIKEVLSADQFEDFKKFQKEQAKLMQERRGGKEKDAPTHSSLRPSRAQKLIQLHVLNLASRDGLIAALFFC